MQHVRTLLLAALLVWFAAPAQAQEALAPDRPGLGLGTAVVGPGALYAEVGLPSGSQERFRAYRIEHYTFPVLLRLGLTPAVEVRAATNLFNITRSTINRHSRSDGGFDLASLELGAKLRLAEGAAGGPALALVPSVVVPLEGGAATLSLNAAAGLGLPGGWGLGATTGAAYTDGDVSGAVIGSLGRGLTAAVAGFVEAGVFPGPGHTPAYVGGGLTVLVDPAVQFDVYADRRVGGEGADWFFGAGLAFRVR